MVNSNKHIFIEVHTFLGRRGVDPLWATGKITYK